MDEGMIWGDRVYRERKGRGGVFTSKIATVSSVHGTRT